MPLDKDAIRLALTRVMHPTHKTNLVEAGSVEKIAYCDGYASIRIAGKGLHADARNGITQQATAAIRLHAQQAGEALHEVHVEFSEQAAKSTAPAEAERQVSTSPQERAGSLPNVRHVIAVGAGKGGVGKSTVSVNLAVGLARRGHSVGLLDGDIYGPSLPTMLNLHALEVSVRENMIQPMLVHGIKATTIGKLVDPEKPLIWRGPMAHGAFKQLVEQTEWGDLDYLIIDLPPGTGDVSLTMAQVLKLTGAVIVCTPQKVAQDDAVRAVRMFQQLGIEIVGVVENMSFFIGDDGKEYDIFGRGGAEQMAQRLSLPFLGAIPITMHLRENSDSGDPTANFENDDALSRCLDQLTQSFESQVALAAMRTGQKTPTIKIS